jgi:nitroreductase
MEFNDLLAYRQSVRQFTDEPVSREELEEIVKAASQSPVGMHNYAGYEITIITNPDILKLMVETYRKVNGKTKDPIYGAPAFILVSANTQAMEAVEKMDAGCFTTMMHLKAANMGLGSVYIYGLIRDIWDQSEWKKAAHYPETLKPLCGLAVGHSAKKLEPRPFHQQVKVSVID